MLHLPEKYLKLIVLTLCVQAAACSATLPINHLSIRHAPMELIKSQESKTHHTTKGFRNLHAEAISKGPFTYLKMKYFGDEPFADHETEAHQMPTRKPAHAGADNTSPEEIRITWIGHSTFLIQYHGLNILTDPILSQRASPISFAGPKRLVPLPIEFQDLPEIDYIIISHNHYDHLDTETVKLFGNKTRYLVPLKLKEWFIDQSIDPDKVIEFDWWDKGIAGDLQITATPSQHWSARTLLDRNETLWAAWHIQIKDFSIWFAGDTGYNDILFKEIGERFGQIDLSLIPIGAYAPRWFMKAQHVNPEEAVKIHQDIRSKKSIGMHWGTFQLSAEKMQAPKTELESALAKHNIPQTDFLTMAIGETISLPEPK